MINSPFKTPLEIPEILGNTCLELGSVAVNLSISCHTCNHFPSTTIKWIDVSGAEIDSTTSSGQTCKQLWLHITNVNVALDGTVYKCHIDNVQLLPPVEKDVTVRVTGTEHLPT